jgi:NAD(P)H dehydrogenase (quinone)
MARVLIVYHTLSGNTEKMAKAFEEGAKSVLGTEAVLKKAFDATLEDLLGCDAIAFGSADYFSNYIGSTQGFL